MKKNGTAGIWLDFCNMNRTKYSRTGVVRRHQHLPPHLYHPTQTPVTCISLHYRLASSPFLSYSLEVRFNNTREQLFTGFKMANFNIINSPCYQWYVTDQKRKWTSAVLCPFLITTTYLSSLSLRPSSVPLLFLPSSQPPPPFSLSSTQIYITHPLLPRQLCLFHPCFLYARSRDGELRYQSCCR